MVTHSGRKWKRDRQGRRGAAAAEFAVVLPLLSLILLGSIDVGQAIYCAQVVNEASREAARQGSRFDTTSQAAVTTAVQNYISQNSTGMSGASVQVNFADSSGTAIANGDLSNLNSGETISVQVSLAYDSVRWLPGISVLGGSDISTTTIMRRE